MGESYVWVDINSKTKDHPRHREILFNADGSTVRLIQKIIHWQYNPPEINYEYDAKILPGSDCSLCASYPVEWIPSVKLALDRAAAFEEKSRPHWEKLAKKLEEGDD